MKVNPKMLVKHSFDFVPIAPSMRAKGGRCRSRDDVTGQRCELEDGHSPPWHSVGCGGKYGKVHGQDK